MTTTPTRASATIFRQPVTHPDRSVYAYAVRGAVPSSDGSTCGEEQAEHLVDALYRRIDMVRVTGHRPLFVRATAPLLAEPGELVDLPRGLILEVPPHLQSSEDVMERLAVLTEAGVRLALGDYTGAREQNALLPAFHMVKVDAAADPQQLRTVVRQALDAGVVVVAENAVTRDRVDAALAAGVELLQGPLVLERRAPVADPAFSVGEIQCLELIRLVSGTEPDPEACARTIASDPELSLRVLHLVNSSAMGVRQTVDSVHRAVVLVGPRHLLALATASLVGSAPAAMETLWYLLTRATACRTLTGDDTGYTVGLLSAIASHLDVAPAQVVARTGVSGAVAGALEHLSGGYGQALAAVLAQEQNDVAGLAASGLDPYDVGHAYLDAMSTALSLASRLAAV